MVYQRNEDGTKTLVGTGALSSVDPDRIMLKKVPSLPPLLSPLALTSPRPTDHPHWIPHPSEEEKCCRETSLLRPTGAPASSLLLLLVLSHHPQDVRWFKPAELTTKYGHRGHIREPVGTHGLFKASFSAPIKQNDTVMLVLYKRVFPKLPSLGVIEGRPPIGYK
jgi:hypothetical protein